MLKTLDKAKKRGLRLKNNFRAVTSMSNYPKAVKRKLLDTMELLIKSLQRVRNIV